MKRRRRQIPNSRFFRRWHMARTLIPRSLCRLRWPHSSLLQASTRTGRTLYFDLVLISLSEAARRALQAMDLAKYEYQSDFARHYIALGEAKGEARGRAALVGKLLASRFGPLTQQAQTQIAEASIAELDAIGDQLLTAQTLGQALGER